MLIFNSLVKPRRRRDTSTSSITHALQCVINCEEIQRIRASIQALLVLGMKQVPFMIKRFQVGFKCRCLHASSGRSVIVCKKLEMKQWRERTLDWQEKRTHFCSARSSSSRSLPPAFGFFSGFALPACFARDNHICDCTVTVLTWLHRLIHAK